MNDHNQTVDDSGREQTPDSSPPQPERIGRYQVKNAIYNILVAIFNEAVAGEYVYLANGEDGLCVYRLPPELCGSRGPTNVITRTPSRAATLESVGK